MDPLAHTVAASWQKYFGTLPAAEKTVETGFSGGLDSVVLLHLLHSLRGRCGFHLSAVHVHHGLQRPADEWAAFCAAFCARLHIPLRTEKVSIPAASPLGTEAAARAARYAAYAAGTQNIVALAHHRDDQTETFFLALLRGGGVRGMSAMPPLRIWRGKQIWRPLLTVPRCALEAYAAAHGLDFVRDPSNADTHYLRNWLRHEILPPVRARIPALDAHIAADIRRLQAALAVLDETAENDWHAHVRHGALDIAGWRTLSAARRGELLRLFVCRENLGTPRAASLTDFSAALAQNPSGSLQWQLPQGTAHSYAGKLWALPDNAPWWQKMRSGQWLPEDIGWTAGKGLPESFRADGFSVRPVQAADTLHTRIGRKNVLKLLQEKKIPAAVRRLWPVVLDKDNICRAAVGVRCDETLQTENGIFPQWQGLARFTGRQG